MGKKTKKTRWRTLSIDLGTSSNGHDKNHNHTYHSREESETPASVSTETKVYFNEDEYTKITTPRQDVLFKKGYFARRKYQLAAANLISDSGLPSGYEVPNGDYLEDDYINEDYEGQSFYNSAPYVDPSTPMYYNYGNNSYEVYDPYTGSMTVLMGGGQGPPSSGGQPMMSCPPMDWYQQQQPYYFHSKQYGGDSAQAYTSPESLCPPTSPQDVYDDPSLYPQSFIYPGYMLSNNYHTTGTGGVPVLTSPPQTSSCDSSSFKKRKRRKKRKKEGSTEEENESSSEDQCSQSGASEQLDSKTTSDSGVHTHNSGESTPVTPPLSISFYHQAPCHPIPAFTSTDEDSTPSMPYYNPYHHINYNYASDAPVTSVIDPHYVMHKSKKLKGKRPKAELNKFFPSSSQAGGPCSYHSRDVSAPASQPPPKQLTILKPEIPRKFPPTQITILQHNTTLDSHDNLTRSQKNDSQVSQPLFSSQMNDNVLTENPTNHVNSTHCSTTCILQTELADRNSKNNNDIIQSKQDIQGDNLNKKARLNYLNRNNEIYSKESWVEGEHMSINRNIKKTAKYETATPTTNTTQSKITERVGQKEEEKEREDAKNQETCQLNNEGDIKKQNENLTTTNGHLSSPEDTSFNRSPSPPKKNMTNGFHKMENIKQIENGYGNVKQKPKSNKKSKTNSLKTPKMNVCDKNQTAEKTEEEILRNGHVTPTNENPDFTYEIYNTTIVKSNGIEGTSIKDKNNTSNSGKKSINDSKKKSQTKSEENCNGILDNTVEDNFETCSNKSEELEELYIKNNPLLAKLVDIESINNNDQSREDKNIIVLNNTLHVQDKENVPHGLNNVINKKEEIINEVKSKTTSVPLVDFDIEIDQDKIIGEKNSLESKLKASCIIEHIKPTENEKLSKAQEIITVNTLDTDTEVIVTEISDTNHRRLTDNKEDSNDKTIESSNSKNLTKKKSDKKKKSKEEQKPQVLGNKTLTNESKEKTPEPTILKNQKTQEPLGNKNGIKEKSLDPVINKKKNTKESPNKEIEKGKKLRNKDFQANFIEQTQNKSEKKNKTNKTSEIFNIPKERTTPEKQMKSKERVTPEPEVISTEKITPEKQRPSKARTTPPKDVSTSTERKSIEKETVAKDRITPSPERISKRRGSKKKMSPPPIVKPYKNETAIGTAQSFIDDMLSEAVNKVKMKLETTDSGSEIDRKLETDNVITPNIPLIAKKAPKLETETKSHATLQKDTKRKLSRQNSNKSIKSQGKQKTKTPERTPSEVVAVPTLHITDVVTKWLQEEHGGKLPVDYLDDDDDEIFVQPNLTGSKNWISNPSLASFPKESARDRVADRTSDIILDRCNAKASVSKYYNLGIRTSPENEVFCAEHDRHEKQYKHPTGPLPPCGICCMIQ